ncbi:MAG: MATE family efflux transporter [Oscillospiraceae bacterium]|jgi:putative MATE family efflux protein|nr:MATE family efflux transporter [Oscillospiraceae bacterium]
MTTEPVEKLIVKLAIPTILIMLVSGMYNMADTYFVGSLGTTATGAVGVSFSLMAIIQAMGFFFGQGAGNFISRALGAQEYDRAEQMASTGFFLAFGVGCVIALLGTVFLTPLARLLGSTETILPYARDYLRYILLAAPFMVSSLMLNTLLRFQGSAIFSLIGMVAGAVLNCVLDPLFIFVFRMGVAGAAIATAISQLVGFILLLAGCSRGGNMRIRLRSFKLGGGRLTELVRGGTPSLLRQAMASVATIFLNQSAKGYGDAVIAAVSVVNRVVLLSNSAMIGLAQGYQPVCGFNFGARLYSRVRRGFWFCLAISAGFLAVVGTLCFIFAPEIIAFFRDDAEVISIGAFILRAQSLILPLSSWIMLENTTFQTTGRALPASILAFARQGIFQIPLLLILVPLIGVRGIQLSTPIADLGSFLLSIPFGVVLLRQLRGVDADTLKVNMDDDIM